jgi:hypothetical protein
MRLTLLLLLVAAMPVWADELLVEWTPPTQYTDGTPLLEQDLDYYTLHMNGAELLTLDAIVGTWSVVITVTEPGTHEFRLTVTDLNGQTSDMSNTATFTVGPRTPGVPTNLTVTRL